MICGIHYIIHSIGRNMAKDYNYKVLISRLGEAIKDEFFLEASWLAYAILEDRLVSALDETGGAVTTTGRPIRMLGPKLGEIKAREGLHNPRRNAS